MILILTMKRIKKTGLNALFLVFVQSDEFIIDEYIVVSLANIF